MGVTVSFTGHQPDSSIRDAALTWARSFAEETQWTVSDVVCIERPRGFLGDQVLEVPKVVGLTFIPHFACEPVPLLFLQSTGQLVDAFFLDEGNGDVRLQREVLVKTQFAGPTVHAEVCEFLKAVKERFVPDLKVDDESGFFSTGDTAALNLATDAAWARILERTQELSEPGADLAIGGIPMRVQASEREPLSDEHRELLEGLETWLATRYGGFGLDFDRTTSSVEHLDLLMIEVDQEGWCDDIEGEEAERIAHALGATFGQAVAATLGGHWEVDPEEGLVLTEIGGAGLIMNPFQVAASRIAYGPSHAFEYHFAVYRDLARRLTSSE
ncbi:MAG: hypothetical protein VX913_13460 [Planctomycetota bacterium]|nr:hypothetical protein [Planctomycetota bacterium]